MTPYWKGTGNLSYQLDFVLQWVENGLWQAIILSSVIDLFQLTPYNCVGTVRFVVVCFVLCKEVPLNSALLIWWCTHITDIRDYSQLTLTQAKRLEMESQVSDSASILFICPSVRICGMPLSMCHPVSTGSRLGTWTRVSWREDQTSRTEKGSLSSWRITGRLGRYGQKYYQFNTLV